MLNVSLSLSSYAQREGENWERERGEREIAGNRRTESDSLGKRKFARTPSSSHLKNVFSSSFPIAQRRSEQQQQPRPVRAQECRPWFAK